MPERDPNSANTPAGDLFPAIEPRRHGWLEVGDGHSLYWEESGNPDGIPVIFLHGGPGAGTAPMHRRFFDPAAYRIMLFDQRGAGRSRPYAGVEANTTDHLIADIETLRRHFEVDKWLVFGGSWGATLAVAYALRHGAHCLGLVLRGVFLGSGSELDWFFNGARAVFPEAWTRFVEYIPVAERGNVLGAYHRRLMDERKDVNGPAARAWNAYETSCSTLRQSAEPPSGSPSVALARIEAHYFVNDMFLIDDLLEGAPLLAGIPGMIVQGRYDMVCPAETAYDLHRNWPGSVLRIVGDAGHSAMEPGIRRALVAATETFKRDGRFDDAATSP
jgi:proline iminopeptidase